MRYTLSAILIVVLFTTCKKDKFTTVPQISFKSFSPNLWYSNSTATPGPLLTLKLTDAEGDFGFAVGKDSSYVYIKNISFPPFTIDSLEFPDLGKARRKDLDAQVSFDLLGARRVFYGSGISRRTDTLYFEIYVKDFAKNKSNVIKSEPLYLVNP